ncbi:SDR family oxidoreductase [Thermoactinomyces daqus]|jgi:3-oxoacyl-[acyl-carrier protein] reductase|uniref:SDR family oxidoreductase n=1 Tax=Thermoactinomyces daqus TaxID=1329516 RepID=A0A7W1X7M4_9BACL|nr:MULTISPECIES: SDR family oxidoreductase [Thermoactinomyces]MBA4541541.1 SDR family oxidoreductase [Thermoactinomyces daqus]MBH8603878.1 SDR family oxidoreductase [Thermoactinomyces sp. CICC 10522]
MNNQVAIVTGGSRGIGAATAKLLARRGAKVIVNYHNNRQAADTVVESIVRQGGEATSIQADVRNPEAVRRLVDQTISTYGKVDILVNNASISFPIQPLMEMSWDDFAQKVNDELRAAFELTKAVLPHMIKQKYGRLIYVSSGLARSTSPGFIAHGVAKNGLEAFVRYVAGEVGPHGITANIVAPGMVDTDATAEIPQERKEMAANFTPMRRIAQPEDVANAIAFFASPDTGFVTGGYTSVSGGSLMI